MVHSRGGASRRLSFILLTTTAFGATAAVAPAQPVHALVLPRQQAVTDSDDAAQPGASVAMPNHGRAARVDALSSPGSCLQAALRRPLVATHRSEAARALSLTRQRSLRSAC